MHSSFRARFLVSGNLFLSSGYIRVKAGIVLKGKANHLEDEPSLIQRAKQGDQEAFHRLVERYAAPVWRTARVFVPQADIVEDAIQESWLDAWRGLPSFDVTRPFRPWLLTIVVHRCRKFVRHSSVVRASFNEAVLEDMVGTADVADEALHHELQDELTAILGEISLEQRRLLALRYDAGLDLAEIATVLQVPLGTVKSRLSRALNAARTRWEHAQSVSSTAESHL